MLSNGMISLLLYGALFIYMVVRQFQERSVQLRSLLILPVLALYISYTNITRVFALALFSPIFLIGLMLIGLVLGLVLGWYRGNLARMRFDMRSGDVFVKAGAASMLIWLILLVVKIATSVVLYASFAHGSLLLLAFSAIVSTLFLGNIVAEKACIYQRAAKIRFPHQKQVLM